MTYTSSPTVPDKNKLQNSIVSDMNELQVYTVPDLNELQINIVQSIEHFSEISKIKVKDNNFIQKKISQISLQRVEFRNFAEESITHNLKLCTHADDLIVFAECCEDVSISDEDLLKLLKPLLNDSKLYKSKATLLKNHLRRIKISLDGIATEIFKYDEEITKKREDLPDKIEKADKVTNDAWSCAKNGAMAAGIGSIAAVLAAPFTGGASIVAAVAESVVGLGSLAILGGTAAATTSTAVAGSSFVVSGILNYQLEGAREQFSQYLREMQDGLSNINDIISACEFHWEKQIIEIEAIIKRLECNEKQNERIVKPIAMNISAKAKKILASSESYSANMRQALNRDSILA
ncbi:unnamed protein product [Rhizophagus irregularis]|uniref:Uncharacterized protein n=1 Tax=Rhizophagus irregularis TaxID=588596 RepID=A0A2N1ND16_9GLOM|nr:hypothetical protein RhiirC2_848896 [Rhizophagus irregularis]CAB4374582.1 unnamed protein product [Rhizophagus irregularis]